MNEQTAPKNESQTAEQNTPDLHQVQAASGTAPAKGSEDNPNRQHSAMSRFERWQVFLASVGVLVAFGGLIVLDKQTVLLTKQTALMNSQTDVAKQQTKLMGLQNDLVSQQSQLMNETTRAVQRAMMQLARIDEDPIIRNGQHVVRFRAIWENAGVTDANDVIQHIEVARLEAGSPTLEDFLGSGGYVPDVVGPRGTSTSRDVLATQLSLFGVELTPGVRPPELIGKFTLLVFGWIAYRDVFPGSKPHVVGFCRQLAWAGFTETNIDFSWEGCRKYNCQNERCEGYESIVKFLPSRD